MHSLRDIVPDFLRTNNKAALARALGVSRSTLERYIRSPEEMPVGTLRQLADMNGYTIEFHPKGIIYRL